MFAFGQSDVQRHYGKGIILAEMERMYLSSVGRTQSAETTSATWLIFLSIPSCGLRESQRGVAF